MEQNHVDAIILVDDHSKDDTAAWPRPLPGVKVHVHPANRGYGGNQKTCYRLALEEGADIVIMIHPTTVHGPKSCCPRMVSLIGNGLHPCVLGSRILAITPSRAACPRLEIRRQPFSHARGKHPARREAFRIPHRVPRLLA